MDVNPIKKRTCHFVTERLKIISPTILRNKSLRVSYFAKSKSDTKLKTCHQFC